jgi:sulfonate transport system permease protein
VSAVVATLADAQSRRAIRGVIAPLLLLGAWQVTASAGLVDPRLLPPLQDVARTAWTQIAHRTLLDDVLASLTRNFVGFTIGAGAGIAFGLLLGRSRIAHRTLRPTFNALKNIALFAWIPLIAMWFGFGEASKIAFIALAAFTPVALNTEEGVRSTPPPLLEVGAALSFTRLQRLRRIHLPAAMPSIVTGLQLGLIHAWLATVGAEYFLAQGSGIGGMLIEGRDRFNMAQVVLGVIVLGGIGFLLNRIAAVAETRIALWRRV